MNEQAIINNAISLGWKDCSFFTVKAHRAVDGSYCPEMRLSQGKFPPNFHWAALPNLETEQPADNVVAHNFHMLLIAIDFDNTFTANPEMWRSIIGSCHYNQTARNQSHDNADLYRAIKFSGLEEVFFTSGEFKKQYLEKLGVHPNIWIDDSPGTIDQFAALQPCSNNAL